MPEQGQIHIQYFEKKPCFSYRPMRVGGVEVWGTLQFSSNHLKFYETLEDVVLYNLKINS